MKKFSEEDLQNLKDFIFLLYLEALKDGTNPPILPPSPDSETYLVPFKMELEKRTIEKLREISGHLGIPLNVLIRSVIYVVTEILSQKTSELYEFVARDLGIQFPRRKRKGANSR